MKILIADDHHMFLEGIRLALEKLDESMDIEIANSGQEALTRLQQNPGIDLVLLDIHMPGLNGFAILASIVAANPFLPVMMLSASESREDMQKALDHGAMGYILKSSPSGVMLQAIRLVMAGGIYIPPQMVSINPVGGTTAAPAAITLAPANGGHDPAEIRRQLTRRQIEVLRHLVEGKSNKEIARALDVAEATIKAHVTAVMRILNVDNRTKAASAAYQLGLF